MTALVKIIRRVTAVQRIGVIGDDFRFVQRRPALINLEMPEATSTQLGIEQLTHISGLNERVVIGLTIASHEYHP